MSMRNSETRGPGDVEGRTRQARSMLFLGSLLGIVVGFAALFTAGVDWVFLYMLGAPWLLADVLGDLTNAGQWLFSATTLCYFTVLGALWAVLSVLKSSRTWRFAVTALMLATHVLLTVTGSRRLFAELAERFPPGTAIPAPRIWPQSLLQREAIPQVPRDRTPPEGEAEESSESTEQWVSQR